MKLTKKLESEILKVYNAGWDAYLAGDIKTHASFLSPRFRIIGTAESEQFDSKKAWIAYCKKTSYQFAGVVKFKKRDIGVVPAGEEVMVAEKAHIYVLIDGKWTFYSKIRISVLMEKTKAGWRYIYLHSSLPDAKANEGEVIATERIKAENIQLREAVKRRTVELEQINRELEIEAALERVRAVAMGMKEPADMLEVCRVISQQLESLDIKDIRNIQTAIFYEAKKTYLNYEFFTLHDKTAITEVAYDLQPDVKAFVNRMQEDPEAFFTTSFKGAKLKKWIEYQQKANQFVDPNLYGAKSLNYYFYSIGSGALGLSSYVPLKATDLAVFHRFRNVFGLAYRRFMDIQQAEVQMREAMIEAALERVRSRSMGMQKSEELKEVIQVVYEQFVQLNILVQHAGFIMDYKERDDMHIWLADQHEVPYQVTIPYFESPHWNSFNEARAKGLDFFANHLEFDEKNRFYQHLFKLFPVPDQTKEYYFSCRGLAISTVLLENVGLYIENFSGIPYSEEENATLMRFGKVFQQTYTRFLDLQKAEAQAREAQIEAALERIRSRSMGMQKSKELRDVIQVIYDQLVQLKFEISNAGFLMDYRESDDGNIWMADSTTDFPTQQHIPNFDHPFSQDYHNQREKGTELFTKVYPFEEKNTWWEGVLKYLPGVSEETKKTLLSLPALAVSRVLLKNIGLYLLNYAGNPYSDQENATLIRFGKVFEQTYTRFKDLEKAEAQAREAQIEAALERVRSKVMAMNSSKELNETSLVFGEQLRKLGIDWQFSYFWLIEEEKDDNTFWITWPDNQTSTTTYSLAEADESFQECVLAWRKQEKIHSTQVPVQDVQAWLDSFDRITKDAGGVAIEVMKPENFKNGVYYVDAMIKFGSFGILMNRVTNDEEKNIQVRFATEFERAYTRFLDLQKAEAQAREAKIEAALEKVRSRTMAMQKSEELSETSFVLFQQLKELGEDSDQITIGVFDEDKPFITLYATTHGNQWTHGARIELAKHSVYQQMYSGWKKNLKSQLLDVRGKELEALNKFKLENPDYQVSAEDLPKDRWLIYNAFFSNGSISIGTTTPRPDESIQLLERFAQVFDHTYTRFLDLQKAEAQAREAKIEAALEKVRSRSLAMHKSDELQEVVHTVFEKLKELKVELYTAIIFTFEERSKDIEWWLENKAQQQYPRILVPYADNRYLNDIFEAREKGKDFFSATYSFEEKNELFHHLFENTNFKYVPGEQKQFLLKSELATMSVALAKNTGINITSYTKKAFSEEENDILKRFGKVFDQAYTRFLDLQKAEAQAREAQIEAALEKIRSRSLAMHKSDELKDVVAVLFEKLRELGLDFDGTGIQLFKEASNDSVLWIRGVILSSPVLVNHPYDEAFFNESEILRDIWQAKVNGGAVFNKTYSFEEKNKLVDYTIKYNQGNNVPPGVVEAMMQAPGYTATFIMEKNSGLWIDSWQGKQINIEEYNLAKRVAKVFEQAYIRFLDLQKVEAQTREAQIQLALERVRARTMAMHKSDELPETSHILFEQMKELGEPVEQLTIGIVNEENNVIEISATLLGDTLKKIYCHSIDEPYMMAKIYKAWKKQQKTLVVELRGDELNAYNQYRNELTNSKIFPTNLGREHQRIVYAAFFSKGMLALGANEKRPAESLQLLVKFASVFDLTYTRFLDLQKAEAQAREAKIEASLERVRARTMAMHNSEDVSVATATMFIELEKLGIENFRGGILNIKENKTMDVWSVNKSADSDPYDPVGRGKTIRAAGQWDMTLHPWWRELHKGWINKDEFLHYFLAGKEKEDYVKILDERHDYIPGGIKDLPDCHIQGYYFGEGAVWTFSLQPHSDEDKQVMKKFASVFSLTFRRYQDLKKAEAQAREAQIEAALERVRTSAMAMQKSDDLFGVAEVLWEQLKKLGQPELESSIVHLYNNDQPTFDAWYAYCPPNYPAREMITGCAITSKSSTAWAREVIANYQSPETTYTIAASGEKLSEWYKEIEKVAPAVIDYDENGQIIVPEILYYHFSKFSGGALLMISNQQPSPEACDLQKRAAVVFDLAYTRFVDLKNAETQAKEAIKQATLDRIRAEIASMRTVADLDKITPLIWNELNILGISFIRCGVFIMDETQRLIHTFLSAPDGNAIAAFHLPYDTSGNLSKVLSHWKDDEKYIDHWDQSAFTELADILVNQGAIASPGQYLAAIPQGGFYLHFLPFLQGMLYVGSLTKLDDEEIRLLQSVADAFSTAYARYEDFNKLEAAKQTVEKTLADLKQAQTQLVQSEKMASLGELTAGIAHEIQNPLNFVNNFSEVSNELLDEMIAELSNGNKEDAIAIADGIKQNLEKILHHGKRADGIVKGMLQHSRSSTAMKEPTDINKLADEYLRLAYHGFRAKDKSFNATLKTEFDESIGTIHVIPQDIGRAVLNLITNAFHAVGEKKKQAGDGYEPTVSVRTTKNGERIEIMVRDNGNGVPEKVMDKIFQPFFTTKPTGQGTGLGLSLAYDIVKAHGGELTVDTKEGEYAAFIVQLPLNS